MCETSQPKRLISDFSLQEITEIFEQAVFVAIAETIAEGLPVTRSIQGQVVDLPPDDPAFDQHWEYLKTGVMPKNLSSV